MTGFSSAGTAQSVQRLATGWMVPGSNKPIPVAARSKAWVFDRSLTRIVGSKADPSGRMV